jgi:HK97 family phage major capsid protein
MSNIIEARTALRNLAAKAQATVDNKSMTNAQKKTVLEGLDIELKTHLATLEVHKTAGMLMGGGESMQSSLYNSGFGFDLGAPRVGNAPNLMPTEDQLRGLHEAVLSHKSFKLQVDTKAVSDLVPDQLVPGIVALPHEPTRIMDLLPTATMGSAVIEYIRHTSTTGTAGMVAPGGLKPSVTLVTAKLEARAHKIAVTTKINDEDLEDFSAFLQYVSGELQRLVIDQENIQILTGDGTGENLTGIFTTSGILTRIKAASPETGIDTLALAAADLRTGPSFVPTTVYAMHPTTWTGLTLLKDTQLRYLLGNPAEQDAAKLWGVPVVQSTGIAVGSVLGMNAQAVGSAYVRQGLVLQTDYGTDGFEYNTTSFRCEERIALAVVKPSAAIKITGL